MAPDVPTLEEVKEEIRDDVEYLHTGRWIICEINTEEYTTAGQAQEIFGEEKALEEVAKTIRKRKRREIKSQERKERREKERKRREELREQQEERMEREQEYLEDLYEEDDSSRPF